ncbi:CgeB family protein [Metabacillus arenae]|uniref:Glycosyltransferase n=1 Tax=Metabacillus arenae TaxID=2771434 RepID=A0A926NQ65_9BACI|nr:glycosyltransferase [Metabacillus arenae]MBD1381906.1 glycosyltransferase [Metabacillus arenae]
MKVIYIQSGYQQIYAYLEKWFEEGFKAIGLDIETFPSTLPQSIIERKFDDEKPLFALTMVGNKLEESTLTFLKNRQIPLLIWLTEDPFYIDSSIEKSKLADMLFTIDFGAYNFYKKNGIQHVYYLPLGTDSETFKPNISKNPFTSDLLVLGFPYPSRIKLVETLLEETDYKITVVGKGWYNRIKKNNRKLNKLTIINKWVSPSLVSEYYNGAKIVLNPHRESNFKKNKNSLGIKNQSMNNRTFDIAACGAFQLVEYKKDVYTQFKEEEMIAYIDLNDCINKIHHFMQNETKRKNIASLARKRAITDHTMKQRAMVILNTFLSKN